MQLSLEHQLQVLRDNMLLQLERAGDMAEGGNKDGAREWLHFFENSRVFELLGRDDVGVMNGWERNRVKKQLEVLRSACHPAA